MITDWLILAHYKLIICICICIYIYILDTGGQIIGLHDKSSGRTCINATCQSDNCIYAIECTKCGQHYVGQTSRHVGRRMYEHYTSIINENMELSVGEHFSSDNNHNSWDDFKFYVLEFCSSPADEAHTVKHEIFACMLFSLYSLFGKIRENFMHAKISCSGNFVHAKISCI